MDWQNFPRWLVVGVLIVLVIGATRGSFVGVMILLTLLWFVRNALQEQAERTSARRNPPTRAWVAPSATDWQAERAAERQQEQRHEHALAAVRAAGRDPDSLPVLPVDIGVMSYTGDNDPVIHRDWAVMDDVDYIQPFVQLRLPRTATGRIRFELVDSDGEAQFVHEQDYQLERGRNLVVPAARLPVQDQQPVDRPWELRVIADGVLLAVHEFEFDDADTISQELRQHILEDGEISNELRTALAANRLERMSLDDLLADQNNDDDFGGASSQDAARRTNRRT